MPNATAIADAAAAAGDSGDLPVRSINQSVTPCFCTFLRRGLVP